MALKLPRLQRLVAIVKDGLPTLVFHQWWQAVAAAIEKAIDDLAGAVLDIQATQAELATTQGELAVAVADIATAQDDITGLQTTVVNAVLKDQTAAWATPTGTFARTTFATYAGQTISATYTASEVQTIDDRLKALEERFAALISDLRGNDVLT